MLTVVISGWWNCNYFLLNQNKFTLTCTAQYQKKLIKLFSFWKITTINRNKHRGNKSNPRRKVKREVLMWRLLAMSWSRGSDQEYCSSDHSSLSRERGLWPLRQRHSLVEWGVPGTFPRSTGLPQRSTGNVKCWQQKWSPWGRTRSWPS